jgi:two-component system sensor histidine kinase KdpD
MDRPQRPTVRAGVIVLVMLAVVTIAVAGLEAAGVRDASEVYLLAVVATAVLAGAWPAAASAVGAFVIYDLLFVEPRYTLEVGDPQEWLNLILLLLVGLVVGRLAGAERDRAETALAREGEALAMFRISFALASAPGASSALEALSGVVREVVPSTRTWFELGDRVVADSGTGPRPSTALHNVLVRRPGDRPATWTRVHAPVSAPSRSGVTAAQSDADSPDRQRYRVAISAGERSLGSLWLERERSSGPPTAGETRVLSAAADQLGRAVDRDRLAEDASAAEIARRSDALKSALLDSVSHDLRTPLASIRAAAGTLMDPAIDWSDDERRAVAASIDVEADRLNSLVSNLLDMSRIEAGALHPALGVYVLADLVDLAVRRSNVARSGRPVTIDIPADLAPIHVDEVLFGQVLANVLDNVDHYAGTHAPVAIVARDDGPARPLRLTIEDGGPGVPDDALPRLFEKFFRAPRAGEGSRRGTGAGLAVVHGLITAMGGTVQARRSRLGGLAIDLTVPAAAVPDTSGTAAEAPA